MNKRRFSEMIYRDKIAGSQVLIGVISQNNIISSRLAQNSGKKLQSIKLIMPSLRPFYSLPAQHDTVSKKGRKLSPGHISLSHFPFDKYHYIPGSGEGGAIWGSPNFGGRFRTRSDNSDQLCWEIIAKSYCKRSLWTNWPYGFWIDLLQNIYYNKKSFMKQFLFYGCLVYAID